MRCFHPIAVRQWQGDEKKKQTNSYHLVPCGKCVACLARRRNDWTYRLQREHAGSSYSFFLTLTYNEDNIPVRISEGKPYYVFNKKHIQDYLKRVRYFISELDKNIIGRYYCVSEYGKKTLRPHYHMQFFVKNDNSCRFHKSICQILEKEWPYGYFTRRPTSDPNIHYVTKYCLKSLEQEDPRCIDRTFIMCSKRPYLGECAEENLEKQSFEFPVVFSKGYRQAMPRIYRQKLGFAGCNVPESAEDPRFSADSYTRMAEDFMRTHPGEDFRSFTNYVNERLRNFERDAIRRQQTRNEKL